ncbi:MAG TPA: DeoR/GlpR family DNA-binding transcription regulator, partial [Patescibacteria group bacterium]|nr:DeoR/GlpR family DNA-binding transcription regulator [Patescibacteria group bacterium]
NNILGWVNSVYYSVEERRSRILEELQVKDKVYVKVLAEQFGVTMETIRRDLDALAAEKKIKKTFGGAIKVKSTSFELLYNERALYNVAAKQKIAATAVSLIEDNDTIALLGGSTTEQLLQPLLTKRGLFVVTNSLPMALGLLHCRKEGSFDGRVVVIGGEATSASLAMSGFFAEDMLTKVAVNKAFLSCAGFAPQSVSTLIEENIRLSQILLEKSATKILLADSAKMNASYLYHFATLRDFDIVVCDQKMPNEWESEVEVDRLQWLTAQK